MKDKPPWKELCELASVEQNPQKLMELITEINHLFRRETEPTETVRRTKVVR
jgi:hypothetical protein